MLAIDTNKNSRKLHSQKEQIIDQYYNGQYNQMRDYNDDDYDDDFNFDEECERLDYKLRNESEQYNNSIYKDFKQYKANDVYIFEEAPNQQEKILTKQERYIPYPRKEQLKEIIQKIINYQDSTNQVDFHPSANDLSGDLKKLVDNNMLQQGELKEGEQINTPQIVKVRNIIHQSLQPYNKLYAKSKKHGVIESYFIVQQSNKGLDQWGKFNKISKSQFLWLPAQFIFNKERNMYEIEGKLFIPLENCPGITQLKEELNHLVTYFSEALKQTHEYFKQLRYKLMENYSNFDYQSIVDTKEQVSFSERIHAIVKVTEMEIQPGCTYNGQWHVEGYSSDNILYTCLYVIEHDERLVDGKLKFKRTSRSDDVPVGPSDQPQSAHSYCPNYQYLYDPNKVIPLGSLEIKENLMIIFPNQNIHKVKGIRNSTNLPLKRKIIALFIVNHIDQPYTINDVVFTKPIKFIKEKRLLDMYERSMNKQTESQQFNYCEH